MSTRQDSDRIYEAQKYLRALHYDDSRAEKLPLINPDGIYGEETREAVREFQRMHGLPITGSIDYRTWTALYSEYLLSKERAERPALVFHFPEEHGYTTAVGENSDIVAIIQFILRTLAHEYDEINGKPPSGVYDDQTIKDIRSFQNAHGIPESGMVDKRTWNSLAAAYNRISGVK